MKKCAVINCSSKAREIVNGKFVCSKHSRKIDIGAPLEFKPISLLDVLAQGIKSRY